MKKDNKGFSLVELIIVIAIMAVLIGILAPTYMRFVKRSKISTDITNAQEMASAINVAITDGQTIGGITSGTAIAGGATGITGMPGFTAIPVSKVNKDYKWLVTWDDSNGVASIYLNAGGTAAADDMIYPTPGANWTN